MATATAIHPEGPRYAAPIVYLSGLWVAPRIWRHAAGYLAHRGWEGRLVDTRDVGGGIAKRGQAVADDARTLSSPPVLVGHDAGALVALAAAAEVPVRALVLVSPLVPGAPGTHALTWSRGLPWALLRGRALGPPAGAAGAAFLRDVAPDAWSVSPGEDPRMLAELARRSRIRRPATMPPTLVLRGEADRLVSRDDVSRLASDLGAELDEIAGHGHWLLVPPAWQACVHRIHRWLVQRLGEDLLELYAEAMADRDDDGS
jgi:pimeloyl-ACP methyl ester carboxylesterase